MPSQDVIQSVALVDLTARRDMVLADVKDLTITNQGDYEKVVDWITKLRDFIKSGKRFTDDYFKPEKEALAHKVEQYNGIMGAVITTEGNLTAKKRAWDLECLRNSQEAQREADRIAQANFDKQKAKGKTPTLPVPVADLVDRPTLQVKSDSGTMSTLFVWKWKYASNNASNVATTKIPKMFHILDLPKIGKFVKDGIWTKVAEVATGEWMIKECPDIIVYQDVEDRARGKREE